MPVIEGDVTKIYYQKDDFVIARLVSRACGSRIILGSMYGLQKGDRIRITDYKEEQHKTYGEQIRVIKWEKPVPTTRQGVVDFLSSGLIKHVGVKRANLIVSKLGENALDVIMKRGPEVLKEIPGIGNKTSKEIYDSIVSQFEIQTIIQELSPLGLSAKMIIRAYRHFGPKAAEIILNNPYRLIDLDLVAFTRADAIARNAGIKHDSYHRIASGLKYCLKVASQDGHSYSPLDKLIAETQDLLGEPRVEGEVILNCVESLKKNGFLVEDEGNIYLSYLYRSEVLVAEIVSSLYGKNVRVVDVRRHISAFEKKSGIVLTKEQKDAIGRLFAKNLLILTGGPGTGKTQTVKVAAMVAKKLGLKIKLCAPTGRAAKILTDVTGFEATTVHRLLGMQPGEPPEFNAENPLPCDLLIVDEFSMVDITLAEQLFSAVPPDARVLIVGDKDQLPSIGPGNVLKDMLSAGLPSVNLTRIFRQSEGSRIALNAHMVNRGSMLDWKNASDFFYIHRDDPEEIVDLVKRSYLRLMKKGYHSLDIQVLSPMKKGGVGTKVLNRALQEAVNPPSGKKELAYGETVFRVGDKVMQVKNDYDRLVYNGEIGVITDIGPIPEEDDVTSTEGLFVRFNGGPDVIYRPEDLDQIVLSYAVTVHKSQGSEYPAVILVVSTQHYVMLARNIIYTAISRAKDIFVLIGTKKALAIAVKNAKISERRTGLAGKIKKSLAQKEPVDYVDMVFQDAIEL